MNKKIGIIGLGTVGEATVRSLRNSVSLIEKRTSLKLEVAGICDVRKEKKKLASLVSARFTTNPFDLINDPDIDIIVELVGGVSSSKSYILQALRKNKDVVTANKALLAESGKEIFKLARRLNRNVGFEASVCGAIPLIRCISEGLVSCKVRRLYGILNGTTNYILHKMERERISFTAALAQAQKKGFAEKKPRLDIEGIDTLHKLSILSYLCFGVWPDLNKVYVEGISRMSLFDIIYAQELSYKIKLLAIAKKDKNGLDLRVHPTLIPQGHPLSQVTLSYNAVGLDVYPAGELMFYGEGAGGVPTSSSVISDIVNISFAKPRFINERVNIHLKNINNLMSRYYIRFMAVDKPGVLAKISTILASLSISIASVTQKESCKMRFVPIVMITGEAKEASIKRAISRVDRLSVIKGPSQLIRIEDL